jgi:RNA polymerase sigma-70 factor (ECF subfamily)
MVMSSRSRVPVKNTSAESSNAARVSPSSGAGLVASTEAEPVDLFRVWCRRIQQGDAGALEAVFRALHEPLVRYGARYLAPGDETAADLVQDAFVRVWDGRERLDPDRSLKAFLYQTVRNLALNRGRDERNRAELLRAERFEGSSGAPSRPDDELDRDELSDRLTEWIEGLPTRQKEALRLSRFDGLSHQEIAEVMGCSPRTVNNHLVKALRTIRDRAVDWAPELMNR